MPELTRSTVVIALSAAAGFLLAALLLVRSCSGGGVGETCGPTGGCRLGLICAATKCVPRCRDDSDCPSDMRCGVIELRGTAFTQSGGPQLLCLDAADAERQVQRSLPPSDDSRLTALSQKRSETYDAVQALLVAENWVLADEDFDKAWDRLPEDLRRVRPPQDLAKLIITAGAPAEPETGP